MKPEKIQVYYSLQLGILSGHTCMCIEVKMIDVQWNLSPIKDTLFYRTHSNLIIIIMYDFEPLPNGQIGLSEVPLYMYVRVTISILTTEVLSHLLLLLIMLYQMVYSKNNSEKIKCSMINRTCPEMITIISFNLYNLQHIQ